MYSTRDRSVHVQPRFQTFKTFEWSVRLCDRSAVQRLRRETVLTVVSKLDRVVQTVRKKRKNDDNKDRDTSSAHVRTRRRWRARRRHDLRGSRIRRERKRVGGTERRRDGRENRHPARRRSFSGGRRGGRKSRLSSDVRICRRGLAENATRTRHGVLYHRERTASRPRSDDEVFQRPTSSEPPPPFWAACGGLVALPLLTHAHARGTNTH